MRKATAKRAATRALHRMRSTLTIPSWALVVAEQRRRDRLREEMERRERLAYRLARIRNWFRLTRASVARESAAKV